jgi:hypothetical protein
MLKKTEIENALMENPCMMYGYTHVERNQPSKTELTVREWISGSLPSKKNSGL